MGNPIELRAHHLRSAEAVLNGDFGNREEYAQQMAQQGYAKSPSDPFIESTFNGIFDLFRDDSRRITLVAEKPDFICHACSPPKKSERCFKKIDMSKTWARAFFPDLQHSEDETAAKEYGFEIGKSYLASEISMRLHSIVQFQYAA